MVRKDLDSAQICAEHEVSVAVSETHEQGTNCQTDAFDVVLGESSTFKTAQEQLKLSEGVTEIRPETQVPL